VELEVVMVIMAEVEEQEVIEHQLNQLYLEQQLQYQLVMVELEEHLHR
jgi:hypothetical protein